MSTDSSVSAALRRAEQLASNIKDAGLRSVAFDRILQFLLLTSGGPATPSRAESEHQRRTPSKQMTARTSKVRGKAIAGPRGRLLQLREADFFKTPRTIDEIQTELRRLGHHYPQNALSTPLLRLTRGRDLRRLEGKDGKKTLWRYCNP